jgi:hypothetical protein
VALIYALVKAWPLRNLLPYLKVYPLYYLIILFGTFIPNTVHAKAIVYQLSYTDVIARLIAATSDDIFLLRFIFPSLLGYQAIYIFYVLLLFSGWIAIFLYREVYKVLHSEWADLDFAGILFAIWCLAVIGAYVATRVYLFVWYEPLYIMPGLLAISHGLARVHHKFFTWLLIPMILAQAVVPVETVLAATISPVYDLDFGVGARARQYQAIGHELYLCYPQARLMTSEIGGLGYGYKGYILDGAGLVTPDALSYHPMSVPDERDNGSIGAIPYPFIIEKNPEIIISYDIFIKTFLVSQKAMEYFHYQLPMLEPEDSKILGSTTFWGSKALHLFVRRDLVISGQTCPDLGVLP